MIHQRNSTRKLGQTTGDYLVTEEDKNMDMENNIDFMLERINSRNPNHPFNYEKR